MQNIIASYIIYNVYTFMYLLILNVETYCYYVALHWTHFCSLNSNN